MKNAPVAAVILAAGKGTRMRSDRPKVLFQVAGRPMVHHVLRAALGLKPERVVLVVGHGAAEVKRSVREAFPGDGVRFSLQREALGTGHALRAALPALKGFKGTVLVLSADVPLVETETLAMLLDSHRRSKGGATVLTFRPADPTGYGRVVRDGRGAFVDIIEEKDADFEVRTIAEVNGGLYAFDATLLPAALRRLRRQNAQGELYLTDVPRLLRREGHTVSAVRVLEPEAVQGVNTLADLAAAATTMRGRVLSALMAAGVEIVDPATTFVAPDARIGGGTRIEPFTVIGPGARIGRGCSIGPFTHLRADAVVEDGASLGNFVEVKKSRVGRGTKVRHLTYLGDADIGRDVVVGAGTITCNFDGRKKHATVVEDGAFLGSGTLLVAPVRVGKGGTTAAGAVVPARRNVAAHTTVAGVPARPMASKRGKK